MNDNELRDIFLAESQENFEELNRLFTELEKDHSNRQAIDSVFRITHTMKANAAGMGFEVIATMAHLLEDVFGEIRSGNLRIDDKTFNDLFRAIDILGGLLEQIKDPQKTVRYKGMQTKLRVMLRNARGQEPDQQQENPPEQEDQPEKQETAQPSQAPAEEAASPEPASQPPATTEEEDPVEDPEEAPTQAQQIAFSDRVQIPVAKLDTLLNLVGELIIERDRIISLSNQNKVLKSSEFGRLQRITGELQYSVMDVRLVQVKVLFHKFHRIVRDTAQSEGKKVDLVLEGTENEIDRNVLQIISDSMIHIVRNAISHGIETPETRKKAGKPEQGTLRISATNEKENVLIRIEDDGQGIDPEKIRQKALKKNLVSPELLQQLSDEEAIQFIFEPGFSSLEQVTEVSGRGVGMDVVRKATDSIGGKVHTETEVGKGTAFVLALPSSMAVKGALLFELKGQEYAIPLTYTESVLAMQRKNVHKVGKGLIASHLEETITVVFLEDLFHLKDTDELQHQATLQQSIDRLRPEEELSMVVVSAGTNKIGLVVDRLLQQKEIVEKPLEPPLEQTRFVSGATILGNGSVCMVVDIPDIADALFKSSGKIIR